MFEGMCVKTIVLIRPMRLAMRAADKAERPARILAAKKIAPNAPGSAPKRTLSQYATKLVKTKPPANASSENNAESLNTTRRDLCKPRKVPSPVRAVGERGGSGVGVLHLRRQAREDHQQD